MVFNIIKKEKKKRSISHVSLFIEHMHLQQWPFSNILDYNIVNDKYILYVWLLCCVQFLSVIDFLAKHMKVGQTSSFLFSFSYLLRICRMWDTGMVIRWRHILFWYKSTLFHVYFSLKIMSQSLVINSCNVSWISVNVNCLKENVCFEVSWGTDTR